MVLYTGSEPMKFSYAEIVEVKNNYIFQETWEESAEFG
jgi:hypothetical protein